GVIVDHHGQASGGAFGKRLPEQRVGALVRRNLPHLRTAYGDAIDMLVLAEADRCLDVHPPIDADHFRRVIETLDQAGILGLSGSERGGGKQRSEQHGAGHLNFSIGRAGARKRLPMPRVRDCEGAACGAAEAATPETKRVSRRAEPGPAGPMSFAAAGAIDARRISREAAAVPVGAVYDAAAAAGGAARRAAAALAALPSSRT